MVGILILNSFFFSRVFLTKVVNIRHTKDVWKMFLLCVNRISNLKVNRNRFLKILLFFFFLGWGGCDLKCPKSFVILRIKNVEQKKKKKMKRAFWNICERILLFFFLSASFKKKKTSCLLQNLAECGMEQNLDNNSGTLAASPLNSDGQNVGGLKTLSFLIPVVWSASNMTSIPNCLKKQKKKVK